jgi:hypothetical protein
MDDELQLVIGIEYDYYLGAKMRAPLIFYMDYRYIMPEQLVIGTPNTILTTFP